MFNKPEGCKNCEQFYSVCLFNTLKISSNSPGVIVIGSSPPLYDVSENKAFRHGEELVVRRIFEQVRSETPQFKNIDLNFTYAVKAPVRNPSITLIKKCKLFLQRDLIQAINIAHNTPVLVVLGREALRALDYPVEKITSLFGKRIVINLPTTTPGGSAHFETFILPSIDFFARNTGIRWMYNSIAQTAFQVASGTQNFQTIDQLTTNYVFPKTQAELHQLIDHIINYYNPERSNSRRPEDWWISLDTETNGLHPQWLQNPTVTIVSVAWDTGKSAAIPLRGAQYTEEEAWQELERLLSCPKPKIFHNWKFDMKFLELVHKKKVNNVYWDSMLGEHYLDEDKKGFYGLKKLVPFYLPAYQNYEANIRFDGEDVNEETIRRTKFTKKALKDAAAQAVTTQKALHDIPLAVWEKIAILIEEKRIQELKELLKLHGLELIPEVKKRPPTRGAELLTYAAIDADVTRQITRLQLQRAAGERLLDAAKKVMQELYLPASRVLGKMEFYGVNVDRKYLEQVINDAAARLETIQKEIHINYDPRLNIRSPQQLAQYMNRANFPTVEEQTTGKDTLVAIAEMLPTNDPRRRFCELLLEYREVHKVLYTYLIPLRDGSAKNGRIHASFHLNGTSTGRLSSSDPNMQNIPKIAARTVDTSGNIRHPGYNIKKIFIPSSPDMYIVNIDIKAAELRTYTAYAKDERMIKILLDGQDPHSWVTAQVFKIPYEEVVAKKDTDPEIKAMRTNCKRTIFGTLYGAGPSKVAAILKIPFSEAKALQQQIFQALPALPRYIDWVTQQIRNKRFLMTHFGRCRRFPLTKYSESYFGDAIREGVNFLIQSTSSDLVLHSLCQLDPQIETLGGRLLFSVHDSIVMELPKIQLSKLKQLLDLYIVEHIKQEFPWLPVPFLYDVEYGENYGELKELE